MSIERTSVESTTIKSVGYYRRTMEIEFVNGTLYRYRNVPRCLFDLLMRAESKGKFFSANIRNNETLKYEKVVSHE